MHDELTKCTCKEGRTWDNKLCSGCGGWGVWKCTYRTEARRTVENLSLSKLLRYGSSAYYLSHKWIPDLAGYWWRIYLRDAISFRLRYDFNLSDWVQFCWFRRIQNHNKQLSLTLLTTQTL